MVGSAFRFLHVPVSVFGPFVVLFSALCCHETCRVSLNTDFRHLYVVILLFVNSCN